MFNNSQDSYSGMRCVCGCSAHCDHSCVEEDCDCTECNCKQCRLKFNFNVK
jgi:hypothetical protein